MNKIKELWFLPTFLFLSLISIFPYLSQDVLRIGHDLGTHLVRIEGIKDTLLHGKLLVNINTEYLYGYGYAIDLFYPNLMLYIPAVFRIMGFSIIHSYKIFILICTFFTFLSMYYSVLKMTKHKGIAFLASVFYAMSAYRLIDVFVRAALGEIAALIFLPISMLGIYYVLFGDHKKWFFLTIGFSGILLSHVLTSLLTFGILLALIVFSLSKMLKEKNRILSLIFAGALSFMLTAYFTLPMAEQYKSSDLYIHHENMYDVQERALSLSGLIKTSILNIEFPMNIGFVFLMIPLLRVFVKKKSSLIPIADVLLIFGLFFFIMSTNLFPWSLMKEQLGKLQFPWRLLIFSTLTFAVSGSIYLHELFKNENKTLTVLYIVVPVIMFQGFTPIIRYALNSSVHMSPDKQQIDPLRIGGGKEYLPYNISIADIIERKEKKFEQQQDLKIINYKKDGTYLSFEYSTNQKKTVELPLIYYKGYQAFLTQDGSKKELQIITKSKDFISVKLQGTGEVTVNYGGTRLQKISHTVSLLTLFACAGSIFFRRFRRF